MKASRWYLAHIPLNNAVTQNGNENLPLQYYSDFQSVSVNKQKRRCNWQLTKIKAQKNTTTMTDDGSKELIMNIKLHCRTGLGYQIYQSQGAGGLLLPNFLLVYAAIQ